MRRIKKAINVKNNKGMKGLASHTYRYAKHRIRKYSFFQKLNTINNARKKKSQLELWEEYEFLSNKIFNITDDDIKKSNDAIKSELPKKIATANWFVPNFGHLKFGGIYTIFRFIEKLSIEGIENRIIIYDNPGINKKSLESEIKNNFPKLNNYEIIIFDHSKDDVNSLPKCDLAFCTFWISAYILLKFNKTKRKYYFIQDYEPLFYAGGSTSALAESTYRFGFRGLVNTPGLLAAVNNRHGLQGISFIPAVDQTLYYPDFKQSNKKVKIFFYARPENPRNAFNLGIIIINDLLAKYGDKIEIVTAGAEWNEAAYGLSNKITNLGLLKSLADVAELYRKCDIGFVYMLSKHPSYQPFEFMASGVATVTNNNEDNLWLLQNGYNCILAEPSPTAMAEGIGRLVEDDKLRKKIAKNGHKSLGYTWEQQTETIWNDIKQV